MALPPEIQTVTVVGQQVHPDGTAIHGSIRLVPTAGRFVHVATGVTVQGPAVEPYADNGDVSITVVASDADGINPTGGTYQLTLTAYDSSTVSFPVLLPKDTPVVNLAAITPVTPAEGDYVIITGPPGPPGASGSTYAHTQSTPAATWQVAHNLGRQPNISVINAAGTVCYADIEHASANLAVITFPTAFAGLATCS